MAAETAPEDCADKMRTGGKVTIRQMEIDDLPSVYHIGEQLFTSEEFPVLYRTWDPFEVTEYFTSDPGYCMTAESSDGRVVGFILATTVEKEGTAWKKYGYVSWIGVDESCQRASLGRRLYKKLEAKFLHDGVRMVLADTEGDNEDALAFFDSLGFSVQGEHIWLGKTLKRRAGKASGKTRADAAHS